MKLLFDENFPKAAMTFLEGAGHDVFDFRGTGDEGIDDSEVFRKAQNLEAILLATDRDFFHTVPHLFDSHCGVIVIALRQPTAGPFLLAWNGACPMSATISSTIASSRCGTAPGSLIHRSRTKCFRG